MGLLSKGKKAKFREIPLSTSQKAGDKLLQGLVEQDITLPTREIAGLSELERQGLTAVGGLGRDIQGLTGEAADVLRGTLRGEFDPRTSPFFQGFRQEAQRLKQEGISDVLRRSQRITGAPAGTALRQTGDVASRADESILQTLGGLFEQERARQFGAVGQTFNLGSGISQLLLGAGQVPRSIEQDILNARFNQQIGQIEAPFRLQAPIAQNLLAQQRFTFTPGVQGSSTLQDIAGIASIAGGVGMLGGLGAAAGGLGAAGGAGAGAAGVGNFAAGSSLAPGGMGLASGAFLSDITMKENIIEIDNALDKVEQLTGYSYNYTFDDEDNRNAGIMAQDLEKVLPDAVSVDDKGVKYVNYTAVVGLLVQAINELKTEIRSK